MLGAERTRRRLAELEAGIPTNRPALNLECLTDDELIALAMLPLDSEGEAIVSPEAAAEVDRILAKAKAHSGPRSQTS